MAKLTIEGDIKYIDIVAKSNRLVAKKYGLRLHIDDNKGGVKSPLDNEPKTANQVAELISKVESLDDLKQYESDKRQVVVSAYNKKLKEFE
jgi:hypothetical protein